jgi:phosphoadenosine phosphosulfate reductase
MKQSLYNTLEAASRITDSVLVGVSGGKDSVVTMDLCFRYFSHVQPFFMYIVKGLEFQEATLRYYEDRYDVEFLRVPHFMLSEFLRYGSFRVPDISVPTVKTAELYNYLREISGIYWIAAGERISDSIVRRAMIKHSGTIDEKRGRIFPVADWNKADIMAYLKQNNLPLSLENRVLGFSFRSLQGEDLAMIKEHFPDDYEKIKKAFPLVDASVKRFEYYGH